MQTKGLIKKSIIVVAIFLTYLGLIFPTAVAIVEVDGEDGVWVDNFNDDSSVELIDTILNTTEGKILLPTKTSQNQLDFEEDGNHRAYRYVTPFRTAWRYFPPTSHSLFEHRLLDWTGELGQIMENDKDAYSYSSDLSYGRYIIHHFSFKLDMNVLDLDNINVSWWGRAANDNSIRMYYWKYTSITKIFGRWEKIKETSSEGKWTSMSAEITKGSLLTAVNNNNYIDICIVLYPKVGADSYSLSTDYIKIDYTTKAGYSLDNGYAITKEPISPRLISNLSNTTDFYWDILTWSDYEVGNAKISYQLLYKKDKNWTLVEETYLDGNEKGFNNPPISINSIPCDSPYDKLKIKANLTTDSLSLSPKLSSWAITWQKNTNKWKDLFNNNFRMEKSKVIVEDGNVTIDPITGDWPMFGQNPQNTRYTTAEGPKEFNKNWWSQIGDYDKEITNCVIIDGTLYITFRFSESIYIIDDISSKPLPGRYNINYDREISIPSTFGTDMLVSSPAVTEDKIIIATGKEDPAGTKNYVIALNRFDESLEWSYEYSANICYSSSPLVYNDKVFVTSWSGDPDLLQSNKNNKVIALELTSGSPLWEFDLPAGSFSTPAGYNNTLYVGCSNGNGNSFFAINVDNGESIWNQSIGIIDRASPVVYNNTVFVMSKFGRLNNIKLNALDAENGTLLWKKDICKSVRAPADSTPAIEDGMIYVASPKGKIFAYNIDKPENPIWTTSVYNSGVIGSFLVTSPAISNNVVYIGTPNGEFFALDAANGNNLKDWDFETFKRIRIDQNWTTGNGHPPVITSPTISNGLVFFGDNNGKLYSLGEFKEPTDQKIFGSVTSIPIKLPEGYWWNQFNAKTNLTSGNKITFSILNENKKLIKKISDGEVITLNDKSLERVIRLRADLEAKNTSVNPQLLEWEVTFFEDKKDPVFKKESFIPDPNGWINEIIPQFSVEVSDDKTGLLVSSAKYVLEYSRGGGTERTKPIKAYCSGQNGTKEVETVIANISSLSFYSNITDLSSINITIYDLAGNEAYIFVKLKLDQLKPTSHLRADSILDAYNAQYQNILISAITSDPGVKEKNSSGVKKVGLYYRFSKNNEFSGDWQLYSEEESSTPTWKFTANESTGYYELSTRAADVAGNIENEKDKGDASFFYDIERPTIPSFQKTRWFNSTPTFSYTFSDDYLLDTIEYRVNFETEWKTIASDINKKTYDSSWSILTEYWNFMEEGQEYYIFFRVIDSVGNVAILEQESSALAIVKDVSKPVVDIQIPDIEAEWTWDEIFKIKVYADDRNGSYLQTVELWYRYSKDNEKWSNWTKYEGEILSAPFIDAEWEFIAEEGNGYYEFYIKAEDEAGNTALSKVFATGVNIFPVAYVIAMIVLFVAIVLILMLFYFFWKIKKR